MNPTVAFGARRLSAGRLSARPVVNIARALLGAACFLELAEDDTVKPDDAVKALEDMAVRLRSRSPDAIP